MHRSTPTTDALPGVDTTAVARWMDGAGLGSGPIGETTRIGGGTQNILVRFVRDGRPYVLRRGPLHLRPKSNDVMLRETRVLAALAGTDVPHPRLIAACADPTVLGDAVFYLMEPLDGFNAGVELPDLHAHDLGVRHAMGLEMIDALASLGSVDHEKVGLGDFGRPDGFLERQVPRWRSELDGYARFDAYPGPDLPGVDAVAAWLESHRPADWRPGIMHGDYHAANVVFSRTGPAVVAIVDWEMCTIGDPLLDLGWMLATWHLPGTSLLGDTSGQATRDELIERYAAHATRGVDDVTWYQVLACYKLGIVLEGTHARAHAGLAPTEIGDALHTTAVHLFDQAGTLI